MSLRPVLAIDAAQLAAARDLLVRDSAWASLTGAFSGGVVLVAFALALGANPVQIGLLAAIPLIAQVAQLPATLLIERVRLRKRVGVLAITGARVLIMSLALLPFAPALGLELLIVAQVGIAVLNAVGGCAVNSWLHQLVPSQQLGNFFSRRLFWGTALACAGTLVASAMVERLPVERGLHAFVPVFFLAGVAGFVSSRYLSLAPEPQMPPAQPSQTLRALLLQPLLDPNFRRVLVFLAAWNVASNVAAPFITVYLLRQLNYPLTTVTGLWVVSQIANVLTLFWWARLSDRLSNKAVLAVVLPAYFLCTVSLVFAASAEDARLQLALLVLVHLVMGVASGGIGLAVGNLGLKLAPQGRGTAYLASIGLVSAVAGGITPIVAGALAHSFEASELLAVVRWTSSTQQSELTVVRFAHWEFLFALSAVLGLYVMHALSRIREGAEVSEREVIQGFAVEALQSVDNLSSIGGVLGALFPFDRLFDDRRARGRAGVPTGGP